jgi:hypothetical protein
MLQASLLTCIFHLAPLPLLPLLLRLLTGAGQSSAPLDERQKSTVVSFSDWYLHIEAAGEPGAPEMRDRKGSVGIEEHPDHSLHICDMDAWWLGYIIRMHTHNLYLYVHIHEY